MVAQVIALLLVSPFALAFLYAGIHEILRYRSDGSVTYGLVYDEDSGTTHVRAIGEDEEAYDVSEYDPGAYNDPDTRKAEEVAGS